MACAQNGHALQLLHSTLRFNLVWFLHSDSPFLGKRKLLLAYQGCERRVATFYDLPGISADLIDQRFNSSEKRLARVLLLLADFGKEGAPGGVIPDVSQETLAGLVGTTRSRVSFFMNRFRKLGFIHYNGGIKVHSSLLNIVLHD